MRLLSALLLLCAVPAEAFLFWGGARNEHAAASLRDMRAAAEAGDCRTVLASAEPFLSLKPSPEMREEAFAHIGPCYEASGSADKAISLYKLAIGLYPRNMIFASRLARIYNRSGFPENAAPLLRRVLELKPGDLEATLGLARAYSEMGFLARAKEFYSKAVALQDFRDAATLREYAGCMLRKRDWEEALFLAGKGERLSPRSSDWPHIAARVRAGKGDYYGAVSSMERVIKFSPERRFRLERALYLLLGGLPRRAMAAAEEELAADPRDALASAVKGMSLYALGERAAAAPYLTAARAAGPFTAAVAGALLGGEAKAAEEAACKK